MNEDILDVRLALERQATDRIPIAMFETASNFYPHG